MRGNVPTIYGMPVRQGENSLWPKEASFRFGHLHLQTGPAFDLSRPHNLPQRPTARAV